MYQKGKVLTMASTAGMMAKNLQVVSFDSEWNEIYLGTSRRNHFTAFCPNNVANAINIDFKWKDDDKIHAASVGDDPTGVNLTVAKWCPMENCTVLVLGSQYGIRL